MKKISLLLFLAAVFTLPSRSQYPNLQVGNQNLPNEVSIGFDMSNPQRMIAGANMATFYYSSDAGYSWGEGVLTSSHGVWSDPCVISDNSGNFYYFHLNKNSGGTLYDKIVCQKSSDGGHTWNDGVAFGLNGVKTQEKEYAAFDPYTGNLYVSWTQDDVQGSSNPLDSSVIRFSRSADGGATFSTPVRINRVAGHCTNDGYAVQGSMPAVNSDGSVCVTWAGPQGIMFTKSTDHGQTWPSTNVTVAPLPVGWGLLVPGVFRATGMPWIACDRSGSAFNGNIYINWSDQKNGVNDGDIWLSKSSDGGQTWSAPLRVNNDAPGKQQFFSAVTVDQVTGYVFVIFYDRRNYADNSTDVYVAYSKDGGSSFTNVRVSESPFVPNAAIFFGDYICIAAHNNVIRPMWTRMENDALSVWTCIADGILVGVDENEQEAPFALSQNYPNPIKTNTSFAYKVYRPSEVSLKIYDMMGNQVACIFENRFHASGQYIESVSRDQLNLPPGMYFYSMTFLDKVIRKKMVVD